MRKPKSAFFEGTKARIPSLPSPQFRSQMALMFFGVSLKVSSLGSITI